MEIKEPDFRLLKICLTLAWVESSFAKGTLARLVVSMFCDSDGWSCVGVLEIGTVLFGCCVEIISCGASVDYGDEVCILFRGDWGMV